MPRVRAISSGVNKRRVRRVLLTDRDSLDVLYALRDVVDQLEGCDDPTATAEAMRMRALMGKFMPKGPRKADGVEVWPHYNHEGRRIDWVSIPPNERDELPAPAIIPHPTTCDCVQCERSRDL